MKAFGADFVADRPSCAIATRVAFGAWRTFGRATFQATPSDPLGHQQVTLADTRLAGVPPDCQDRHYFRFHY